MIERMRTLAAAALIGLAAASAVASGPVAAASAFEIDTKASLALDRLLGQSETARAVADRAVAVLVFPDIVKAGFGLGGQYGEGVLRRGGVSAGYYNIASASFGFQIGAQSYSQALFFMTEDALAWLDEVKGFEIGADANVAVVNEGMAFDASTSTLQDPIVAFVFGQQGLMAGATIEGSKITRIRPR
jgi:lipid-binding SYLF domain-containing protein